MLPDRKLGSAGQNNWGASTDRRWGSDRERSDAEAVVIWAHSQATPIRYRLLDASEGGLRIHSSLPLREGASGNVVSLLPSGTCMNREFQVVWCRKCAASDTAAPGGYEAGLRFATS